MPPPTPTPTTGAQPTGDTVIVTLADEGSTIRLSVGQKLVLELASGYDWVVSVANHQVLAVAVGAAEPAGSQGVFVAQQGGLTTLTAAGDPLCRKTRPACGAPSLFFSLIISVQ